MVAETCVVTFQYIGGLADFLFFFNVAMFNVEVGFLNPKESASKHELRLTLNLGKLIPPPSKQVILTNRKLLVCDISLEKKCRVTTEGFICL